MDDEIAHNDRQKEIIASICDGFSQALSFSHSDVERLLHAMLAEQGAKLKDVAHAIRVTTTGRAVGPGLYNILSVIGSEIVVARLRDLIRR